MMLPSKQTIPDLLEAQTRRFGERIFLLWEDLEISFTQLDAEANRVCGALRALGIHKGDKVAVLLNNCSLYVTIFFGIARAGAVFVPINPRYSTEEMARVLHHSDASTLIFHYNYWQQIDSARRNCPLLKRFLVVGGVPGDESKAFEELVSAASASAPEEGPGPEDLMAIIYTSGTTGTPKGVMLTHWNYVVNAYQAYKWKRMTPEDRFLTALPLCHVAPQVGAILAHLYAGGSVALLERFSPREFLAAIEKYRVTAFGAVPTIYSIFLSLPDRTQLDFSSLRYCNTSAAPMPRELFEQVQRDFGASLLESYGLTEGTCGSFCNPMEGARKPGSIGLPLEGQSFRIVNKQGEDVPQGKVGELIIQSPTIMNGYYKDPRATAETIRNGWLYTGDLAYCDKDGYVFLVGRKKEIIVRGGCNIYPGDVEAVIYRHPKVQECAVVGIPDDLWGECIHACIIPKSGESILDEEVLELCRESLTDYKVPVSISYHEEFPCTSTRKVKRRILAQEIAGKTLKSEEE